MQPFLQRLHILVKDEGINILENASVAIIGIGGVGSFTAEALARSGVGTLILVDKDNIDITNINRQIHALHSTIGQSKVEAMKARILDINPNCNVITKHMFYTEETYEELFSLKIDFLVDASDTIKYKIHMIKECLRRKIKFISSMGAANKLDPTQFKIVDIRDTKYDPIAKIMRQQFRKDKINSKIPVVYSEERPLKVDVVINEDSDIRKVKTPPSSNAFTPSVAGLICASYVVNQLLKDLKFERNGS